MRPTLTLHDDVARRLRDLAPRNGTSFKETVNAVLRRGLSAPAGRSTSGRKVRLKTFRSEFRRGVDASRLNRLVDDLEAGRFVDSHSHSTLDVGNRPAAAERFDCFLAARAIVTSKGRSPLVFG